MTQDERWIARYYEVKEFIYGAGGGVCDSDWL